MTAVRKYSLVFGKGKFIPVHGMKTHEESRSKAPLTLTLALQTYINITYETMCVIRRVENDEDAKSEFIPEKGNVHIICT
jgi:hypothetical protein